MTIFHSHSTLYKSPSWHTIVK